MKRGEESSANCRLYISMDLCVISLTRSTHALSLVMVLTAMASKIPETRYHHAPIFERSKKRERFFPGAEPAAARGRETPWEQRCWLAVTLHAFAEDVALFQISQDLVLLDRDVDTAVAKGASMGLSHVKLGLQVAQLVQQASTDLVKPDEYALFCDVLEQRVGRQGGAQQLDDHFLPLRDALLSACAAVDPTNPSLRHAVLEFVDCHALTHGSTLNANLDHAITDPDTYTRTPRVVRLLSGVIQKEQTASVQYIFNPSSVRIAEHTYKAACYIEGVPGHYVFVSGDGTTIIDSHGGGSGKPLINIDSTYKRLPDDYREIFLVRQ